MRHISIDLIRATEAAALSASRLVGSGNKLEIDRVSTEALRKRLNDIGFAGRVIYSEGEKDQSYFFEKGELVGKKAWELPSAGSQSEVLSAAMEKPKFYDLVIDSTDGTSEVATAGPEAMSILGIANEGCLYSPSTFYMDKIVYGPTIAKARRLRLKDGLQYKISCISDILNKPFDKITVCILDRPRHKTLLEQLRKLGTRIKLIKNCDVSASISTLFEDRGIDLCIGVGGSPEGVITACAVKSMKGYMEVQPVEKKSDTKFIPYENILTLDDLVKGDCLFCGTGITDGSLLKGVKFTNRYITNSLFMRSSSSTYRFITTHHGN